MSDVPNPLACREEAGAFEVRTTTLLGLVAVAVWTYQGLRVGLGPESVTAGGLFGWFALAVAGFGAALVAPLAFPSVFDRAPEVPRSGADRIQRLVHGLFVMGVASYLVATPAGWSVEALLLAVLSAAGGALVALALPKPADW